MKRNLFKYAKKFLPLIGIIILLYIIYNLDIEEIKNAFLSINPLYILVALLLTLPRVLIRNFGNRDSIRFLGAFLGGWFGIIIAGAAVAIQIGYSQAAMAMAPSRWGANFVARKIEVGPSAPPMIPMAPASMIEKSST